MTSPVAGLALLYMQQQPVDAAALLEGLPPADVAAVLASAPVATAAGILQNLAPSAAGRCLQQIADGKRRLIVSELPASVAASMLRRLPRTVQEDALVDMPERVRRSILRALRYPALSAGALADTYVPVLRDDSTVSQAIRSLRETSHRVPSSVFVLNRSERVIGSVTAGRLLIASPDATVRELGLDPVQTVAATVPAALVAAEEEHRGRHVAVVDSSGAFVGVLSGRVAQEAANRRPSSPAIHLAASFGELYWLGLCSILSGLPAWTAAAAQTQRTASGDD
ncbi:MAG: CBS domain-containing protein [Bryobacterales bacterium]|nr:CBS domain-containing protein [Bryobacterales bacterium]MDE0265281.1 CBS domain-containing protein [Bryobacterales bacterium]